jgi:hypothetical protein
MAVADGDSTRAESLDVTSKAMSREKRRNQAFGPYEKAVAGT